jgi:hypothetical protein
VATVTGRVLKGFSLPAGKLDKGDLQAGLTDTQGQWLETLI